MKHVLFGVKVAKKGFRVLSKGLKKGNKKKKKIYKFIDNFMSGLWKGR